MSDDIEKETNLVDKTKTTLKFAIENKSSVSITWTWLCIFTQKLAKRLVNECYSRLSIHKSLKWLYKPLWVYILLTNNTNQ